MDGTPVPHFDKLSGYGAGKRVYNKSAPTRGAFVVG